MYLVISENLYFLELYYNATLKNLPRIRIGPETVITAAFEVNKDLLWGLGHFESCW
jgi:hypothetical protein